MAADMNYLNCPRCHCRLVNRNLLLDIDKTVYDDGTLPVDQQMGWFIKDIYDFENVGFTKPFQLNSPHPLPSDDHSNDQSESNMQKENEESTRGR
jgi:hypothetical protein